MKIALIGGGGVRAPEFTRGTLAYAKALDIHELWLMDSDGDRLLTITALCQEIARGSQVRVYSTTNLDEALAECSAIVTTVRVGGEHGRVLDERIALAHGVLGQETTGAGGFAMAMRSIPAILHVAERASIICPHAYLFNFTNPAGLVVQALADAGFERVVGICDSANGAQHAVARWAGVPHESVSAEVYGLNHLSWARAAVIDGHDVLPSALADDSFLRDTHLHLFAAEWVRHKKSYLNEYLYYWYYRDVALQQLLNQTQTRGEEVEVLNRALYSEISQLAPRDALAAYDAYNARRSSTYMSYNDKAGHVTQTQEAAPASDTVDGYAGVALRTMLALIRNDATLEIALNVRNGAAIAGLRPEDVVEVSCRVSNLGIEPIAIGDVAEDDSLLIQAVKRYERLASEAIRKRDRTVAIDALVAHPLVASYPTARALLDAYTDAHRTHIGGWM